MCLNGGYGLLSVTTSASKNNISLRVLRNYSIYRELDWQLGSLLAKVSSIYVYWCLLVPQYRSYVDLRSFIQNEQHLCLRCCIYISKHISLSMPQGYEDAKHASRHL